MATLTIEELRVILSKERLVPYGENGDDPQFIINKYNENVLLSEAMYPALHYFEVLLRNHINLAIEKLFYADWLINVPRSLLLSPKDKSKINLITNDSQLALEAAQA